MPAPSTVELFEFERFIESAAEAQIAAHGVDEVIKRGDHKVAKATRAVCAWNAGEAPLGTESIVPVAGGGDSIEYVRRAGVLDVQVVTERSRDVPAGGAPKLHAQILARVREAFLSRHADEFNARMPYHVISLPARDLGCEYQQDAEHGADVTIQRFALVVDIRPDAWPVA